MKRIDGPAAAKLASLITALKNNNGPLAVQRARMVMGMVPEDVVFGALPDKQTKGKLRRYLNDAART